MTRPPKSARHPLSLESQVQAWLERSGLTAKDLPGTLDHEQFARTIHFFDINGRRMPAADVVRRFGRDGVDPEPKYLHPKDEPPHIYYPQAKSVDWQKRAKDIGVPRIAAEGCAKATLATKLGFPTFGIEGCWGWRARERGLLHLPEFNDYVWTGSKFYWVPDHDRKPKSVADVLRASYAFGRVMQSLGAQFHLVWLPLLEGRSKVGLDDFLYHYSEQGKYWDLAKEHLASLLVETKPWQDYELTDPDNARRWVSMHGSQFRYAGRDWLIYRNGVWERDELLEQQETTKQMFEEMIQDAEDAADNKYRKALSVHVTAHRVESVARMAKSDPAIVVKRKHLDCHPLFVNCLNGTIELPVLKSGGKLLFREARPEDLLTKQAAARWDPSAKCPAFLKALDVWTAGDRALQRTIQQLLGISATGVTDEQVFIVLYGPGQSGKSTLIEIVREVLASYAIGLSAETLLVRRNGTPEERKVASLPGARFASACETEQSGVMDENLVKLLTGQDTVTGRRLYEEQFDFMPQAKIWLRTNNRPEIRGTDNAIWRRIIALPFGHIIPDNKKDPLLREKLRAERDGILRWMIEGYMDYAQHGIVKAPVVLQAIAEYQHEQDVFGRFFEDECVFGKEHSIRRDELYYEFARWFTEEKAKAIAPSSKTFKVELLRRYKDTICEGKVTVKRGMSEAQQQERRWLGISLKTKGPRHA